ncbi:MAG: hypothetical protein OXI10_15705, partial [Gammaproteobacteria bacterium]|nr:hypothetical protein [Gammaproteobacteria bacterium]
TTNRFPILGFDMRHDWLETVQIPPSGGLDEFDRKVVRNDYPLLAIWEMGVRNLRIPFTDLVDSNRRRRLIELARLGFRFTLFSHLPSEQWVAELVLRNADLIDGWEIAGKMGETLEFCNTFRGMMSASGSAVRLFFSPVKNREDILRTGQVYYHVINHGFRISDFAGDEPERFAILESVDHIDGIVLRCGINDPVDSIMRLASEMQLNVGLQASVHLRLTEDSPATLQDSEVILCNRLAEGMFHAWHLGVERIFSDTLTDNDRGYFPRTGLLDREFNPRAGATLVKVIHSLMSTLGPVHVASRQKKNDSVCLVLECKFGETTLILPQSAENQLSTENLNRFVEEGVQWVNWETGHLDDQPASFKGFPVVRVRFS